MKIGILTFWWSEDNYGQILQCYALQKYLKDKGHEAYLIRYDPKYDYNETPLFQKLLKALNPKKLILYFINKMQYKMASYEQKKYNRGFSRFRDKYLTLSTFYNSYKELKENPPDADVYIVGSDQVWNFNSCNINKVINLVNAYFLNFGDKNIKRISYAASWSRRDIPNDQRREIQKLLNNFNYISVREKDGIKICQSCGVSAEWVPDPTLLLQPDSYRELYKNEEIDIKASEKYLFLYLLNNKAKHSIKNIKKWAKSKNLRIIYVTGNNKIDKEEKYYPTIPNWLYLIDNAEYIITNSYHACIFSIMFDKKFAAIKLNDNFEGMNTRFESLWELFDLPSRYLDSDFKVLEEEPIKINREKILKNIYTFEKMISE